MSQSAGQAEQSHGRERGASGKKCLSLTLSPGQPGKRGGEGAGEKGPGSIKEEENNTLLAAEIRRFFQRVCVLGGGKGFFCVLLL